jgi:hypothetical protein
MGRIVDTCGQDFKLLLWTGVDTLRRALIRGEIQSNGGLWVGFFVEICITDKPSACGARRGASGCAVRPPVHLRFGAPLAKGMDRVEVPLARCASSLELASRFGGLKCGTYNIQFRGDRAILQGDLRGFTRSNTFRFYMTYSVFN